MRQRPETNSNGAAAGARVTWVKTTIASIQALTLAATTACSVNSSTTQAGSLSNQDAAIIPAGATGIACTTDVTTHVALCSGTSQCPNISVDTQQFPNCGFRTLQPTFDLECICFGNYLCPVGVVSSCQEIAGLFSGKTLNDVCNQVSLGYCTQNTGIPANGTGGATSTCNQDCYSGCVGAPTCIVACGC